MQLTPWVLTLLTLLVLLTAPVLTALISAQLLSRYRRAVQRHMRVQDDEPVAAAASAMPARVVPVPTPAPATGTAPAATRSVKRAALTGPWQLLARYAIAGLALAAVFAAAASFVYPHELGLPGFVLALWIYLWPVVVSAWLILPVDWRHRVGLALVYAIGFALLIAWAHTIKDIPGLRSGTIELPARSSATPQILGRLWLVVAGAPTLLALLCFNRWARAVAPLVLAFVTVVLIGILIVWMAVFSHRGVDLTVGTAVALDIHVGWLLTAMLIVALIALSAAGWALLRWLAAASARGSLNARTLMLDALFAIYASFFTMWLVLGGIGWIAIGPLGFVAYKLVILAIRERAPATEYGLGLTFLRVFSGGRRSERLLERIARYWCHIGRLQLIGGPDTARSTVQPHQFLDFIAGRLSSHFVSDIESLTRTTAMKANRSDSDGLFPLNSVFCRDDNWRIALPRLFGPDDLVLMDLRGFTLDNAGCRHELAYLVDTIPVERCVLVVDNSTERAALDTEIEQAWDAISPSSPNTDRAPAQLSRLHYSGCARDDRALIDHFCAQA